MSDSPHDNAESDFSPEVLAELRRRRDRLDTTPGHPLQEVLADLGIAPHRIPRHPPDR